MKEKRSRRYYTNHYNYLLNRYNTLSRALDDAYEREDLRAIDYYEVSLTFALDELMDAKAEYIKNK